jgi:hypothetical protein
VNRSTKALAVVSYSLLAAIFIFFCVGQVAIAKEMKNVLPKTTAVGVQHDADWYAAQHIMYAEGYSYGEDGLIQYRQPDDTTGYPALDNVLRFVWNNAGMLLAFAILTVLTCGLLERSQETHNEQMRRETEELEAPGLSEDIHEPFNAPEGMQPATQYVPIRTRS